MEVARNTTIVEVAARIIEDTAVIAFIAWIIVETEAAAEFNHKSATAFDTDHKLRLPLNNFDYCHNQTIKCLLR